MTGVDPLLTLADSARQYAFAVDGERAAQATHLAILTTETQAAWQRAQRRTRNRAEDVLAAALRVNGVGPDAATFVVDV